MEGGGEAFQRPRGDCLSGDYLPLREPCAVADEAARFPTSSHRDSRLPQLSRSGVLAV